MSNVTGGGVLLVGLNAGVSAAKGGAGFAPGSDGHVNVLPATIGVAQGIHGVVEIGTIGRAGSNLKCDTAQPVRCRPYGNKLLARHSS
jgi:hypothetical protein